MLSSDALPLPQSPSLSHAVEAVALGRIPEFALAQDTLTRTIRSLEWNLIFSHLIDGSALAGKLLHLWNMRAGLGNLNRTISGVSA